MVTLAAGEAPKRPVYHVDGPGGFTQAFDFNTVDILVRLGLIKWVKTTSSDEWETHFYTAVSA